MRFAHRNAIVCGAASGMGAATAARLHAEGAAVFMIGTQPALLEEVAQRLGVPFMACDVTSEASVRSAVARAEGLFAGRIDVLVNAAGIVRNDDAAVIEDAVWQLVHEVNLGGTMRLMRAVLPVMVRNRYGSIVNVASVSAFNAGVGVASYASSKAGVVALSRAAANTYGVDGVRVNALCPGWVDTPMSQREMQDLSQLLGISVEEAQRRTVERIALGRMARAEELASVAAFLASEDASFVTGAAIVADGGSRIAAASRAP